VALTRRQSFRSSSVLAMSSDGVSVVNSRLAALSRMARRSSSPSASSSVVAGSSYSLAAEGKSPCTIEGYLASLDLFCGR